MTKRTVTILAALLCGAGAAWVIAPRLLERRALEAIASHDPAAREAGWARLLDDGPPSGHRLASIGERLAAAPRAALLDGAARLRRQGSWTWEAIPAPLVIAELRARADESDPAITRGAAEDLALFPLEADAGAFLDAATALMRSGDAATRRLAFEGACGWAGSERAALLRDLPLPETDTRLRRLRDLALAPPGDRSDPPPAPTLACRTAADARLPAPRRRQAAWRCPDLAEAVALEVLAAPPADPDGSVCTASLLAERALPRETAVAQAERWIRSFDDDEKRAGALLAALLGAHRALLRAAHEIEDAGPVRTAQRLALGALGESDAVELAHRALHARGGEFDPDAALALLLHGRADALALLTAPPPADPALRTLALPRRTILLERFVPSWPRPGPDDFDALEARRLLASRRLALDPASRTFQEAAGTATSRDRGG